MRKLQDRVQKTKDQVQKSRENYEMAINDINAYNAKYMEDMTEVFEKCQRMEAQRLQCFKDILFDVQKCLNITENPEMPQIYEEFYHTVNNADHEQDLRWWSNTHGVNMAMNWPQFEEYMEEFRDIAKGTIHKKGGIADGSITLINQRHVGDDLPEYNPVAPKQNGSSNHKPPSRNNGHSMAKVPSSTGSIQQQSGPPLSKTANNGQALSFNHLNGSHPYHHSSGFGSMSTLQVQDLELSAPPSYSPTSPLPALKPAGVFAIDSPTLIAARRKIMGKRYEDGPTSPSTPPSLTSSALVEDLDVRTPPLATPCPSEREPLHQEPTPTPEVPNSPVLKQSPKKTQVTQVKRTKRISLVARTNNLPRKESNTTKPRKENFVSQRRQKQSNLSLRKTSKAFHYNGGVSKDSNPFDEDEWEDEHVEPLVDNGDIFEKLEEEDEQGWCKGRKDGKVGLYPANYIEVVD
ncbi:hypothetical protein TCAL_06015 [Tigriopus californicus]|uniref:F-BAR domain-containing protein n=1 Tax=Tigriopus californicus TaxID=6832 RepID=A0A553P6V3_TIGCA|nr:hypothetical protein TCAL_06015 [Tigriopus californicus]|eukprot:TCALIF_06015-PA protein Name:"Similar to PACSIN3 Protein kinase C and casein kinase substrate in neurons protein 3 (Homo sapiens)" AED:0.33 eAED:0.33 QI:0/0/0/0.71/1/1/7/0/461